MNVTPMDERTNHNPSDSAASHASAPRERPTEGRPGKESKFAHRAGRFAKNLPGLIDDQLRRNPYPVLAVASVAAAAAGIVLSSRVLRAVLTAAMTAAALDVGRALVRQARFQAESA
jgi:hypothetical protein